MACILIIDDDDQFRTMLRMTLERAGYETVEARDGAEGLECYQAHPVDVVITDIVMPGKEGLETIQELWWDHSAVKIIAISGGGQKIEPHMALACAQAFGAQYAFSKPVDRAALLDAIQHLLGREPGMTE